MCKTLVNFKFSRFIICDLLIMPGLGLPQQPAPAQLLEVVHHRALADILQFLPNGDGSFRVERVRQQRQQHLGRILAHVLRHE